MSTVAVDDTFMELVEPLRRELTAHCYRMVGSVHDAEDLVQETYLRAWRAYHGFEDRSSLRTWMYKIATNTCLTALQGKDRRPLPTGLGQPSSDPSGELITREEVLWLEPLPDALVWATTPSDPEGAMVTKDSIRLAFVAALQHLTAQQRAVVILRDVLAWQASEVAAAMEISVASVNSSLQRARAHLAKLDPETAPQLPADDERAADLIKKYVAAFEGYDMDSVVSMLTEDAVWEMPPFVGWYYGPADIGVLVKTQCPAKAAGDMRVMMTSANGEPVLALYFREEDGVHRPFQLQQLTITEAGVSHVACYFDTKLFAAFGLPAEL